MNIFFNKSMKKLIKQTIDRLLKVIFMERSLLKKTTKQVERRALEVKFSLELTRQ